MTYILGSRCKDGAVLVADKKITVNNGIGYEYEDKLIGQMKDVLSLIIGFSGNKEPFTEFQMRFRGRSPEIEKEELEKKTDHGDGYHASIDKLDNSR